MRAGPPIVSVAEMSAVDGPVLAATRVGQNGDARSKWSDFLAAVDRVDVTRIDLVLCKLCYVDVLDVRVVDALFADYLKAVTELQNKYPGVLVGHITVPLRVLPLGIKATVYGWLRGPSPEVARNGARHRFNQRLRQHYGPSGLLFDLANIEAHGANGELVAVRSDNERVPSLAPEWSRDGGHLNDKGCRYVANAFVDYLRLIEERLIEGRFVEGMRTQ